MPALILVTEDNPQSLDLMCYVLERAGHTTMRASHGGEALEAAGRQRPDLIVMDVQMPVMDGYEAASRLKREPTLRRVPLVAVTAFAMVGDKERVLAAGYDGYITKPILPETFVQQVDAFLPADLRSSWSATPEEAPRQAAAGTGAPKEEKGSFDEGGSRVRVLVVDDQPFDREFLSATLGSLDCDVATAASLEQADEIIHRQRPDLIITDLNLPGRSGNELLRKVKSDPELRDIPVVVVSASSRDSSDRAMSLELGAERFVRRPIAPEDFLDEIRSSLAVARERSAWRVS